MPDLIADVKSDEKNSSRLEDALHLAQRIDDLFARDVDDAIERGNPAPRVVFIR
jgi:hypothetical protein